MNSINARYAGFWKRLLAYLIDTIPIFLIVFLGAYFFFGFDRTLSEYVNGAGNVEVRIRFLEARNHIRDFSITVWILYSMIADASFLQGTFGKHLLGLRVVTSDGHRLSLGGAALRNISKILSFVALFLGFIWIAFSRRKQGWHDLLARAYVVR